MIVCGPILLGRLGRRRRRTRAGSRRRAARWAGTGPSTGAARSRMAAGATIDAWPAGVSTSTRRSAGWVASAARSLTNPYAVCARSSNAAGVGAGEFCERGRHQRVDGGAVRHAGGVGVVARAGGQVRLAEHRRAELAPLALVLDRDQHERAVLRGERPVGADRGMREADPGPASCRCPRSRAAARSSSRPCRRTG